MIADGAVSRETDQIRVVVLGTGTGVGKTHAAVALVAALAARGDKVCGLKPIESGLAEEVVTDGDRLAGVSTVKVGPAPYRFPDPVSPHLAARRTGVTLSAEGAGAWVLGQPARIAVVETAGAVLSPLGPGVTNADLARAVFPHAVILVGLDRLGILHEVTACLLALSIVAPDLPRPVVVLNEPAAPDASTGTNAAELTHLAIAPKVFVLPRLDPTNPLSLARAQDILAELRF